MTRLVAIAVVVLGLALAGCGSSGKQGSSTTAGGEVAAPRASEPLEAAVQKLAKALTGQSCADFAAVDLSFLRNPKAVPGGPPVADECKFFGPVLANLKGFRPTRSVSYGTAALAEGPAPASGKFTSRDAFFGLDVDGKFRYSNSVPAVPQIGTVPTADRSKAADTTVARFVTALRAKDCQAAYDRLNVIGTVFQLEKGDKKRICDSFFGAGAHLVPQLAEDPAAKPVRLGGTKSFAFYGLATKKGYYTLVLSDQPLSVVQRYIKIHPTFTQPAVFDVFRNTK